MSELCGLAGCLEAHTCQTAAPTSTSDVVKVGSGIRSQKQRKCQRHKQCNQHHDGLQLPVAAGLQHFPDPLAECSYLELGGVDELELAGGQSRRLVHVIW